MPTRALWPFEPVQIGSGLFYIDQSDPVGLWQDGELRRFVEWPNAEIPGVAFTASLFPTDTGVWIAYAPNDVDLPTAVGFGLTAAFVRPDGLQRSVRLGENRAIGADTHGVWGLRPQRVMWSEEYLAGSLPDDWRVELTRYNVDGSQVRTTFDRPIRSVAGTPGGIRIEFDPSPPLAIPTSFGGIQYKYTVAAIEVRESDLECPISAANFEQVIVTDDVYGPHFGEGIRARFARERLLDRPEIPEEVEARWPLIDRSQVDVEAITSRALEQFQSLDAYWRGNDEVRPISDRLSNSTVELQGEWPYINLIVYFNYSRYPGPRFRYTLPLFDQGGRPALDMHASIHFMEDLDTKQFLPPIGPVGDYIDF